MEVLVSIILPVYNGELYLKQAIESVLSQTYPYFELIIVNDCSIDNTLNIANHYKGEDERIIIINNIENKKLPASLNIGHEVASGDYMTWTSHDNILKNNFIEELSKNLKKEQADIVYSNYDLIQNDGKIIGEYVAGPLEHLLFRAQIGASFMYKKDVFIELNGYKENLFLVEDYDFWFRAALKFNFYHLNKNLYQYRVHQSSLSSNILQDKLIKENYKKLIISIYKNLSQSYKWQNITMQFILEYNLEKKISIFDYIQNRRIIKSDILKFNRNNMDDFKIIDGLIFTLRHKLIKERENHTFMMLINILLYERKLLFHKSFSKKKTLKLIWNCIF